MAQKIKFYAKPPRVANGTKEEFNQAGNLQHLRAAQSMSDTFDLSSTEETLISFLGKVEDHTVTNANDNFTNSVSYNVSFSFRVVNEGGNDKHKVDVTVTRI